MPQSGAYVPAGVTMHAAADVALRRTCGPDHAEGRVRPRAGPIAPSLPRNIIGVFTVQPQRLAHLRPRGVLWQQNRQYQTTGPSPDPTAVP